MDRWWCSWNCISVLFRDLLDLLAPLDSPVVLELRYPSSCIPFHCTTKSLRWMTTVGFTFEIGIKIIILMAAAADVSQKLQKLTKTLMKAVLRCIKT